MRAQNELRAEPALTLLEQILEKQLNSKSFVGPGCDPWRKSFVVNAVVPWKLPALIGRHQSAKRWFAVVVADASPWLVAPGGFAKCNVAVVMVFHNSQDTIYSFLPHS